MERLNDHLHLKPPAGVADLARQVDNIKAGQPVDFKIGINHSRASLTDQQLNAVRRARAKSKAARASRVKNRRKKK